MNTDTSLQLRPGTDERSQLRCVIFEKEQPFHLRICKVAFELDLAHGRYMPFRPA